MKQASVNLLVAGRRFPDYDVYHDDDRDEQPVGQVDLYLSDFVGSAGLPPAYCRPSTDDAAGITRFVILIANDEADLILPQEPYNHSDIRAAEGHLTATTGRKRKGGKPVYGCPVPEPQPPQYRMCRAVKTVEGL
jgi:hypothetical protein